MEKLRIKIFDRIFKRFTSKPVLVLLFVTVLLAGVLWMLLPILDGASEIFFPGSTSHVIEFYIVAVVLLLFHITCFSLAAIYRRSVKYLVCMMIPFFLFAITNYFLYPSDMNRVCRRVDSFKLGAKYRIRWAGGASKVRQEAITLLAEPSGVSLPRPKWPDSILGLRASAVTVDKKEGIVDVEIPRRRFFFWGDQFGYLITDANAPEPVIINDPRIASGHRLWKISEGIYLYEKWP
jgi:hypothetical protein